MHLTEQVLLPLQRLTEQRFDPEKFAGIFTSGGSGPPRWLHGSNGLIADK
jgi:hypothetical protein